MEKLTPEQAETLKKEGSLDEVEAAIKELKNDKSLDGLTLDFYKAVLDLLGEVINHQLAR